MDDLLKTMPLVAMRDDTVLPGCLAHFDVGRPETIRALETAMMRDNLVFVIAQKDKDADIPESAEGYQKTGCVCYVKQMIRLQTDMYRVLVEGQERADLIEVWRDRRHFMAKPRRSEPFAPLDPEREEAMIYTMLESLGRYSAIDPKMGKELRRQVQNMDNIDTLLRILSENLPLSFESKQKILDADSYTKCYEVLMETLIRETGVMMIRAELQQKLKERVDQNQKKYILREQMQLIREELGEDTTDTDAEQFEAELARIQASDEVKEKIQKEINRFKSISQHSAESSVSRNYIDTLLSLPWDRASVDNTDLKKAAQILERDHYGLEKAKERMLEFLAVRNMTRKGHGPIICLVGPPGTGKTSIAKSVAEALGKQYARISLGGIGDEAEIRGHRRTYIGSMPGRIIQALRQTGVKNPLILLDEIDKTGSSYKGDTASALLEILDGEQNRHFSDHYIEIPVDLSEVLFITTANDIHQIPRPLLDRMEVIEVSGYSENEKVHIAKEHLVAKQRKACGLTGNQLNFREDAIEGIIRGYTREAGVRSLEREIGSVCRKAAREIYEGEKKSVRVTSKNLEHYLGNARYSIQPANEKDEVGIVRGLAWTSVGGVTLQTEVNILPGKGELRLTGQMGDVMKESAQAGISYIRSVSASHGIDPEFFASHDIHIHLPEGAVPKDGPSAGITMATAIYSAVTDTPVRADVAMTGEITLRGRVLPIGGLKEKLLAAKMAGIRTVLVPEKNRMTLDEISDEIKDGLEIICVSEMDEVLSAALAQKKDTPV